MKAEDTVMSDKVLLQKLLKLPDTSGISEYAAQQDMNQPPGAYYKAGAQAQAEISFKAGMKEVVEWIEDMADIESFEDAPKLIGFTMLSEDLQAKLKEGGIK